MSYIKKIIKRNHKLFFSLKYCLIYARYAKSWLQKSRYADIKSYQFLYLIDIKDRKYHCFFGYYDKSPINRSGTKVVFLKVKDGCRPDVEASICIYDIPTRKTKVIGKTQTWNWQQSCMLQWIDDNTISFNDYENGKYITKWLNVNTLETKSNDRAAYFYCHDFTKYLSLNFYRLDKYAKGYGYPFQVDSMDVEKDGIWEVDVRNNTSKLLLSLKEVIDYEPKDYKYCQHYINHVGYCPDENYIIFIHRWQVKGGEFVSRLIKYDKEKGEMTTILDNGHVSHYCWKSKDELLIYATNNYGEKGYMVVNILTLEAEMVDGMPLEDGHPSYSNDKKWILTDTYPNGRRKQYIFFFDVEKKILYKLDSLFSPFRYFNENRCDLHPRWSYDNNFICVDNTATGLRSLKLYRIR